MRNRFIAASALAVALTLGGCTSTASFLSGLAVSTSSATSTQAKTLAEAIQITTLAEQGLDLYVQSPNPSQAVLAELRVLVPAVHNALKKVEAANTAGNSALTAAALAGFNEALAALQSYKTLQGVS